MAALRQWRVLESRLESGLGFLAAWRDWKGEPDRPQLLHYVAVQANPVSPAYLVAAAAHDAALAPLAAELANQWFGLTPGTHRLTFEAGRVTLTLHVNELRDVLRHEPFVVDAVLLDERDCDLATLKAIGRHCRRGSRVEMRVSTTGAPLSATMQHDFTQCGFVVEARGGVVQGVFDPAWQPKNPLPPYGATPSRCVVVGAGLAGAAVAASLALRGWQVTVLDAADEPATGGSGVPVALLTPHFSPDDALLSRLARSGVRATVLQARQLLREGLDWRLAGSLERRAEPVDPRTLAASGHAWSRVPTATQIAAAGLAGTKDSSAVWHEQAAWIRPKALVQAWLTQPGIEWRGNTRVCSIQMEGSDWVLRNAAGEVARAPLIVVAAALESSALTGACAPLQAVRGQVSWGQQDASHAFAPFAVNGGGHFIPAVPHTSAIASEMAWFTGSTFDRDDMQRDERASDHLANLERLRALAPGVAAQLESAFADGSVRGWAGVRCASSNRRPIVSQVRPGLWMSTAMGSRGLTFARQCAEVLAAHLHAEPLPVELRLAESLAPPVGGDANAPA
ncbi:FAD-dependent 5-carboxymethylaminomethyl-2-thiouridine(34) oxidoreductase MnmC [Caenimonas koreensis]|uniref:FAD-dependent 5-carboxymethylaminomethyl-2-thiouridine(34) oxidoreductase MnmC n=1 Tax=Caenimonas koreensis TaxID=367474 RepID=UPI0037849135